LTDKKSGQNRLLVCACAKDVQADKSAIRKKREMSLACMLDQHQNKEGRF
jgi:hypothetical protein